MFTQIFVGTAVVFLTILIQVLFIGASISMLSRWGSWLAHPPFFMKTTVALTGVVVWLMLGISVSAWLWAVVYLVVGTFDSLEPAVYFSIVTFTTLGYGDVTLDTDWRLLGAFSAVNGLIVFGLNTAFLAEFTGRVRSAQEATNGN